MSESITVRRLPDGTKIGLLDHAHRAGYTTLESWLRDHLTQQGQQPPVDPVEYKNMQQMHEVAGQRWRAIQEKIHGQRGVIQTAREDTADGKGGRLGMHIRTLLALIDEIEQQVR